MKEPIFNCVNQGCSDLNVEQWQIFMSYFRGREDVFARLWVNKRRGTKGYSPVCANEWREGICNKRQSGCGRCSNKSLVVLDERWINFHLFGIEVIGIYPLLKNNTCLLLAMDFDKKRWLEDVFSFAEVCRQEGVPIGVERSRSGNGAHAWIFFKEEVPAGIARRMGKYLISKTKECPEKELSSFDRMFPNQDRISSKGLGNLITLPFQGRETMLKGNSVFINRNGQPHEDQWGYLQSIEKISLQQVRALANLCPEDVRETAIEKLSISPLQFFNKFPKR